MTFSAPLHPVLQKKKIIKLLNTSKPFCNLLIEITSVYEVCWNVLQSKCNYSNLCDPLNQPILKIDQHGFEKIPTCWPWGLSFWKAFYCFAMVSKICFWLLLLILISDTQVNKRPNKSIASFHVKLLSRQMISTSFFALSFGQSHCPRLKSFPIAIVLRIPFIEVKRHQLRSCMIRTHNMLLLMVFDNPA